MGRAGKVLRLVRVMRILRVFKVSLINEYIRKDWIRTSHCVIQTLVGATLHRAAEFAVHSTAGISRTWATNASSHCYCHNYIKVTNICENCIFVSEEI